MCSVEGCDGRRRSGQRFKLPEDPERRLEWVQFLAVVNKQRFKESSWTDITICSRHFRDDCFENVAPSHSSVQLKSSAVPTLCPQSDQCVEPETTEEARQCEALKTSSQESGSVGSPAVPPGVPCPAEASHAFKSQHGQMKHKKSKMDLIREKAERLQMKGKYIVNEKRLLQLFSRKCPSCRGKVKTEKVIYGLLLILNQRCLHCEYRNQWKSQENACVPSAEDGLLTRGAAETQQADDNLNCGITAVPDEQSDPMSETESSDEDDIDSDEDWNPGGKHLSTRDLETDSDEETEQENQDAPLYSSKHSRLCTDCGMFFNKRRPHTCEHKIKPFSCNICGKRCVSEGALNLHNKIHEDGYEHRCKYCHVTFRTKVDKISHEQTHLSEGKPYKCPDCSETFANFKERRIHLEDHRGPKQLKCHICGREFLWPITLQRHLLVHTGQKPYKCSVCQRGFSQSGNLKSHMRLHTGERPYKCQYCEQRFNHNVSLKSHVQRYHTSDNWKKRGANSPLPREEKGGNTDEGNTYADKKRRSTGRPIGRPKSNVGERQGSSTSRTKVEKSTRTHKDSENERTDSDTFYDSGEEEEETVTKSTESTRERANSSDSDSDFDPDGRKRTIRGKTLGKCRKRQRKTLEI